MPLKKDGGSLTIGYGSGGSPPLVIPSLDSEGLTLLKISLFSWPPDPFHNVVSFRMARHLPDNLKGPWATTVKRIIHHPSEMQRPLPDFQQPLEEFSIGKPIRSLMVSDKTKCRPFRLVPDGAFQKPTMPRSIVPHNGPNKPWAYLNKDLGN